MGRVPASDGVPIAYTSRGSGDVTLVFVHGWSCDQTYWRFQVPAFSDRYRVVTVDLPGHGESGLERDAWSLEGLGADLATLIEHLDLERAILIGHSMGGAVIAEAATRVPSRVIGLIGVETFHNAEFSVPAEQWQPLVEAYRQDFVGTCQTMVNSMFLEPESELALSVRDDMCSGPADVGTALMAGFGTFRGSDSMAKIKVPIRAINAEHSLPTQIEINRRYSPGFDAVVQEGVGHFLMLEAPERFNELLAQTITEIEAAS